MSGCRFLDQLSVLNFKSTLPLDIAIPVTQGPAFLRNVVSVVFLTVLNVTVLLMSSLQPQVWE